LRPLIAVITVVLLVASAAEAEAAPKARFKATPRAPTTAQVVKLDARASKCRRCRYRWQQLRGKKARKLGKGKGRVLRHRFPTAGVKRIRLTVIDRHGRRSRKTKRLRVRSVPNAGTPVPLPGPAPAPVVAPPPPVGPPPVSPLPPLGQPSCVAGATTATTAEQVRSTVEAGENVCVTTAVGDVNLNNLTSSTVRNIGTSGAGSMGALSLSGSSRITLRARFRSTEIADSNLITIEQSRLGGTDADRTLDTLIHISAQSDDVVIRDSELAWTDADNSGNTGYGIRAFHGDRMRIERNSFHNIGADAMQLGMDADLVIDRNEVAYTARPADSDEHSDDLQLISNGPNTSITNNYFHHCGWLSPTGPTTGCNSEALHAGTTNSLDFENNVEAHALGLPFIGDLGTGGTERSNATFRNNTWWDNGTQFADKPDLQWGLDGGVNNVWERNLVVAKMNFSPGAGFAQSGTRALDNLVGSYAMNAIGECISAACNRLGAVPIGYRKPAGVRW
jgi:hypothetical protein